MIDPSSRLFYRMVRQISYAGLFLLFPVCLSALIYDWKVISSFLLGMILWMFPTLCFVKRVFCRLGMASSRCLLRIFYQAEWVKLLLVGFFFVMVIRFIPVNFPVLLVGYLAIQFVFLILLIMKDRKVYYGY